MGKLQHKAQLMGARKQFEELSIPDKPIQEDSRDEGNKQPF
jgi:hypothetical protein